MTPHPIRSSRPHESVLPRAHTDESHRRRTYGRLQPMDELDRDEAAMTAAWNLVWRAWPWLCTAALIGAGIVLYPAAHFAWVNVW